MTGTVKAADLKRGDAIMWHGERRIVEVQAPDESNSGRVLLHVFGSASWWSIPTDSEVEVTS